MCSRGFLQTPHHGQGCRDRLAHMRSAVANTPAWQCTCSSQRTCRDTSAALSLVYFGVSGRCGLSVWTCLPRPVSLVVPESPGASPFVCLPVPPRLQQPLSFAASVVCIFQNIIFLKSCGMKPFHVDFFHMVIGTLGSFSWCKGSFFSSNTSSE